MLLALSILLSLAVQTPQRPPAAVALQPLAVLYVGEPGTERERAFVDFLRSHFMRVGTLAPKELSQKSSLGFDVVVADGRVGHETETYVDEARGCATLRFGPSYSLPTVLVGPAVRAAAGVSKFREM
ncbi:MAG: hypothetical protein IPJ77_09580 [Planctomycetes bacterium]|nr:hypothetical protein [Planctomycetota bacterium]